MRAIMKTLPAALALFAFAGCEDSATPPTAEQQAANVESQKAAMEKFHAQNKGGKIKADAASPEAAPVEDAKPAENAKPAEAPPAAAPAP